MTIKEIINKLSEYDDDMEVFRYDEIDGEIDVDEIKVIHNCYGSKYILLE